MVRAIIFDLDGVIVDAAGWHYEALSQALSVFGFHISPEDHERHYNGLPTTEKLRMLSEKTSLPKKLHPLLNELKQRYTDQILAERCVPVVRITQMLEQLRAQGYLIGLASNSRRQTVDDVLQRMEIRSYFDTVLSHEEIAKPKPSAEIYLSAFQKLGVSAEETLIVEDSPTGLQSAHASKAHVLAVSSPSEVSLETILAGLDAVPKRREVPHAFHLQILIPMAGEGTRFQQAGYHTPKPFIDVSGKPMIQWVAENVRPHQMNHRFFFLCQSKQLNASGRNPLLDKVSPNHTVVPVPSLTQGAACTTLLASDVLDPEMPLLLANSDQWVEGGIDSFLKFCQDANCDGAILTFPAEETKWSYAFCEEGDRVTRVAEKQRISPHATVGIYYFKRAKDYLDGAQAMIRANHRTNGEFYVCPVYNELISRGQDIRIFSISASQMHGLGTPEDLKLFLKNAPHAQNPRAIQASEVVR